MPKRKSSGGRIWSDPDDAPELTEAFFAAATVKDGERLIRNGPGRPRSTVRKVQVTLRLDPDVVSRYRETGEGWQTRINQTLREAKMAELAED